MTVFREYTSAVDAVNQIVAGRMGINRTDHRVLEISTGWEHDRRRPRQGRPLDDRGRHPVVDRLEDVGYVRRVRDTEDRRHVLVEQTPEGTKTAMRYYTPYMNRSFRGDGEVHRGGARGHPRFHARRS